MVWEEHYDVISQSGTGGTRLCNPTQLYGFTLYYEHGVFPLDGTSNTLTVSSVRLYLRAKTAIETK